MPQAPSTSAPSNPQLQLLQEQLNALSGEDKAEPEPDAISQFANQLAALSTSFQAATAASARDAPDDALDSKHHLDAALKEAGDRYKKIKQLEQLVKTYSPEDYNAAKPALQRQLWRMANKQVYTAVGVLGYTLTRSHPGREQGRRPLGPTQAPSQQQDWLHAGQVP